LGIQYPRLGLNRAIELSPDSRPSRLSRGVVYWTQKKNKEAREDFDAVLQLPKEKQLFEAAYYRGQLYLQLGKVKEALDDFDLVVKENPSFRPVYLPRARIHAKDDIGKALEDLDAYLAGRNAFDPKSWEAHGQRGRLLRLLYSELPLEQRQQPSSQALATLALTQLEEAVKGGAQAAEVFDDLGAMLEFKLQLKEAIAAYGQGLELVPNDVKLLNKRGWAYVNTNQNQKALADFTRAARVERENAEAHSGLGYLHALGNLPPEAQQEADLALLHGAELRAPENYLNLHNVACIYASLSAPGGRQAPAYKEVAMALLRRAVHLWEKAGTGPNEIALIEGDSAFKPLEDRDDFQELIGKKKKKKPQH
jgi:tetratricopeptide (TPR) repeat protein